MSKAIFWHRRDLRIEDNAGLFKACQTAANVQPIFIFDTQILSELERNDARVEFLHREIERLSKEYSAHNIHLRVEFGNPVQIIPVLAKELQIDQVFTNRDYEPYALQRDKALYEMLQSMGVGFTGAKDHVIFEKNEVMKGDGTPYTVFTPYSRKWKERLSQEPITLHDSKGALSRVQGIDTAPKIPSLAELGFEPSGIDFPSIEVEDLLISKYSDQRNFPAKPGTSRLGIHLRFGTISIRTLALKALPLNETFLNELIWREFYQMIIYHFPYTVTGAFRPAYDAIVWEESPEHFKHWCEGTTGYPLVDAGMRELNATGFMHNRVRMVTASFLTKHLLIDWRLGEAYFAKKLLDFELASNVGGWQWAAGGGCDAAPYFRVFNPTAQQEKFDPKFEYIKHWVPEYGTSAYPKPIIEHTFARNRVLDRFKTALNKTA
jgi:deoxyribodipyrimidine photo-lyase